ncbi:hypothetical protein IID24_05150 [Patescibacteria group bacterium]|nr:hypothetical protein [Patescibacteria group bacterium]
MWVTALVEPTNNGGMTISFVPVQESTDQEKKWIDEVLSSMQNPEAKIDILVYPDGTSDRI